MSFHSSTIELKDDTVIVVLGASGDLAKKKTFPALFGLVCDDTSSEIGETRRLPTNTEFF
jgi:glucose-6-phosphate 1-dehydrogenase